MRTADSFPMRDAVDPATRDPEDRYHGATGQRILKPGPGNWRLNPCEIGISGFSGSGKTTLISGLLGFFREAGIDSGYIKNNAHKFLMDKEGKDTHTAWNAGATMVGIRDPRHHALIAAGDFDQAVIEQACLLHDVLLVEGNKSSGLPKLFLLDDRGEGTQLLSGAAVENLLAVVGSSQVLEDWDGKCENPYRDIPRFDRDDIAGIAAFLLAHFERRKPQISALILAGGQSSRMGEDKAEIRYRSVSQIERMVSLAAQCCEEVFVSVGDRVSPSLARLVENGKVSIIRDTFRNIGPLGGILTAFARHPQRAWMALAVDMPYLTSGDLSRLLDGRNYLGFATSYITEKPEPLCALYEPKCYPRMLALLGRGVDCPRGFLMETPHVDISPLHDNAMLNANHPHERDHMRADLNSTAGRKMQQPSAGNGANRIPSLANAKGAGGDSECAGDGLASVEELDRILRNLEPVVQRWRERSEILPIHRTPGRVLADDLRADRDQPPFDRAAMDGIALSHCDVAAGKTEFPVSGVLAAGSPPQSVSTSPGDCCEIMTGAAVPRDYDTVIQYEALEIRDGLARLKEFGRRFGSGDNIHHRGADYRQSDLLLPAGSSVDAPAIAVLASTGLSQVPVEKLPEISIVSTGSELVDIDEIPEDYQIRRSNVYSLAAELKGWADYSVRFHLLPDDRQRIETELAVTLESSDLVIISGGVSKGKFDYVPQVLRLLGVEKLVQGIRQKPGKPFFLGTFGSETIVFSLPGNPVSSLVNFRRYLLPLIHPSAKASEPLLLGEDLRCKGGYVHYYAVRIETASRSRGLYDRAVPLKSNGSGDFFHLARSHGFVEVRSETCKAGSVVDFYPWAHARAKEGVRG